MHESSLGYQRNMSFDTRYFLARIVALLLGSIGVLHPLCINDAKTRFFLTSQGERRARNAPTHFFNTRSSKLGSPCRGRRSICKNKRKSCATLGNQPESTAIGIHSSKRRAIRKIHRISLPVRVSYTCAPFLASSLMHSNCSRLISLGYLCFSTSVLPSDKITKIPQLISRS